MANPILQALTGQNNMLNILTAMKNGNVDGLYQSMMNNNPQFRRFVEENKNLSMDQIASKYGVDSSLIKQCMK